MVLALDTLSKQGQSQLTINRLVSDLGVTKGSFYWHFENRADFVHKLLEYWAKEFTEDIGKRVLAEKGDAAIHLYRLMEVVTINDVSRYDIAVRAWAHQDTNVAKIVKRVNKMRMNYVQSLFRDLGFKGEELEIRSTSFLYWASFEHSVFGSRTRKEKLRMLKKRFVFFTRP